MEIGIRRYATHTNSGTESQLVTTVLVLLASPVRQRRRRLFSVPIARGMKQFLIPGKWATRTNRTSTRIPLQNYDDGAQHDMEKGNKRRPVQHMVGVQLVDAGVRPVKHNNDILTCTLNVLFFTRVTNQNPPAPRPGSPCSCLHYTRGNNHESGAGLAHAGSRMGQNRRFAMVWRTNGPVILVRSGAVLLRVACT